MGVLILKLKVTYNMKENLDVNVLARTARHRRKRLRRIAKIRNRKRQKALEDLKVQPS